MKVPISPLIVLLVLCYHVTSQSVSSPVPTRTLTSMPIPAPTPTSTPPPFSHPLDCPFADTSLCDPLCPYINFECEPGLVPSTRTFSQSDICIFDSEFIGTCSFVMSNGTTVGLKCPNAYGQQTALLCFPPNVPLTSDYCFCNSSAYPRYGVLGVPDVKFIGNASNVTEDEGILNVCAAVGQLPEEISFVNVTISTQAGTAIGDIDFVNFFQKFSNIESGETWCVVILILKDAVDEVEEFFLLNIELGYTPFDILVDTYNVTITNSAQRNGDLRLARGSTSSTNYSSGRLEIFINGEWGTVCDDEFGLIDANVACRQLGYSGASSSPIPAADDSLFGSGFGAIWLDELDCSGNESCLLSCSNFGIGPDVHDCNHDEDVAIFCSDSRYSNTDCSSISTTIYRNGDLRLARGSISTSNYSSGRLEIYINGEWGTICGDSFDFTDANVACQQLGYSGASSSPITASDNSSFGSGSGQIWLDDVGCSGNESCLISCSNFGIGDSNCSHVEDVAIFCSGSPSSSTNCSFINTQRNGDLRLSRASTSTSDFSSGRLEIYINGEWGTVCINSFSSPGATVACRQLGYSGVYRPPTTSEEFRFGSGPIWLDGVGCSGNESCLLSCSNRGIGVVDCVHFQDVAIFCSGSRDTGTIDCSSASMNPAPSPASSLWAISFSAVLIVPLIAAVGGFAYFKRRRRNFNIRQSSKQSHKEGDMTESIEGDHILLSARESEIHDNPQTGTYFKAHPYPLASTETSTFLRRLLPEKMIIPSFELKLHDSIGQGEFGVVYKAHLQWCPTELFAVKTLKGLFTPNDVDNLVQEVLKMHTLSHPNVMSLTGVCLDTGGGPAVVMPYMDNGSVLNYLKKERGKLVPPDDADCSVISGVQTQLLGMCLQISKGMEYLTKEKIVHRDLAARNCMMDANGVIKVADFGLSENIYTSTYYRQIETDTTVKLPVRWMPPESITDGLFTEKSDIWSFGVTCWEVFTGGHIPYGGISPVALLQLLHNGERLNKPMNPACSDEIYAIMRECWKEEPKERPDFSKLVVTISLILEAVAGYMVISLPIKDERPVAAEVEVKARADACSVQSPSENEEGWEDSSVIKPHTSILSK